MFPFQFGEVELTDEREQHIFQFHPDIKLYRKLFAKVLAEPEVTRKSKFDSMVLIFYRRIPSKKYLALVVKTNHRNFILAAMITHKIQHKSL